MKDETLMLYYYNDGLSAAERRAIAAALADDEQLAERYEALCRDLDALREPADAILPEGLQRRLQANLQRAARLEEAESPGRGARRPARAFAPRFLAWGGALAAALALGIGIGLWLAGGQPPDAPVFVEAVPEVPAEWSAVAFQRGLESHFRSGRSDLAGLSPDAGQGRASLIASLIQQNRLYGRLALQNDAPELARVLRSFEPLLLQLAREDLSPQEAAALQAQLEFEFAVMLTKLLREPSRKTETHQQEMSL